MARRTGKRRRLRNRQGHVRATKGSRRRDKSPRKRRFIVVAFAAIALIGIAVYQVVGRNKAAGPTVDVRVPAFTALAQQGARHFDISCAGCHGEYAKGTGTGPPLVHRIYEPSHHGDNAIGRAVRLGVRPHHWRFGPMPKVEVSDRALESIIAYIRELQRANGIR